MKFVVLFAALVGVCAAQFRRQQPFNPYAEYNSPTAHYPRDNGQERYAKILKSNFDLSPDGSYQYDYQTDNGISAEQSGYPRPLGGNPPEIAETVQGRFSWTSPEGQVISIAYVSDENGYRPVGDAIPTPPPIPEAILRSIEFNRQRSGEPQRKYY